MHNLAAQTLMRVWEAGVGAPFGLETSACVAALSGDAMEAVVTRPVGEIDRDLLALREEVFGPELEGLTECPDCGERLEFVFPVRDLVADGAEQVAEHRCEIDALQVSFRLPSPADVALAARLPTLAAGRQMLLQRCVVSVKKDEGVLALSELSASTLESIEDGMAGADPQGACSIALTCPACGNAWESPMDIGSFVWREIDSWAERMMDDISILARAYGWSEAQILGMSQIRRRRYLERL